MTVVKPREALLFNTLTHCLRMTVNDWNMFVLIHTFSTDLLSVVVVVVTSNTQAVLLIKYYFKCLPGTGKTFLLCWKNMANEKAIHHVNLMVICFVIYFTKMRMGSCTKQQEWLNVFISSQEENVWFSFLWLKHSRKYDDKSSRRAVQHTVDWRYTQKRQHVP